MKKNSEIVCKFDSYIKKSLKNEKVNYLCSEKAIQKKQVNFSDLSNKERNSLFCCDEYPSELFEEKISTRLFDAFIHDELLYEALLLIKPKFRELIVLKYWGDMTDCEVGQVLNLSKGTVNKNKRKTLQKLKELMEEMKDEK